MGHVSFVERTGCDNFSMERRGVVLIFIQKFKTEISIKRSVELKQRSEERSITEFKIKTPEASSTWTKTTTMMAIAAKSNKGR